MEAFLRPHRGGTVLALGAVSLAFSLALFGACSSAGTPPQTTPAQTAAVEKPNVPEDLAGVEITLVRTECGGGYCPNYTIAIDGTGRVTYTVRSFVRDIGERTSRIPQEAVRKLLLRFEYARFFTFKDKYSESARDCPTTYLTVRIGDRVKRVENYWTANAFERKPEEFEEWKGNTILDMLARSIDEAVNVEQWIGTKDERLELRPKWKPGWPGRTDLAK
jgi:hypothetical protein